MTIEGKTKTLIPGEEPHTIIMTAKDVLTAGDAARTAVMDALGPQKTAQAANTFAYLNGLGVPTAYLRQASARSLVCWNCEMLPIEFVVRRYAWGSYLKRNPTTEATPPHRFDEPVLEKFHKHSLVVPPASTAPTMMGESEARARYLHDGRWDEGVYTDPMIVSDGHQWHLHPAKYPVDKTRSYHSVDPLFDAATESQIIEEILLPTFLGLEAAWGKVNTAHGPVVLADCKLEVGRRRADGRLVLADVVDNDSWRIWPGGDPTKQMDKQAFRDNAPLAHVADSYSLVTELTASFTR